jgi:uncharacterized protein (DUF1499 family)
MRSAENQVKTLDGNSDVVTYMTASTNVVPVVSTVLSPMNNSRNCYANQNNNNVIQAIKPTERLNRESSESSPD